MSVITLSVIQDVQGRQRALERVAVPQKQPKTDLDPEKRTTQSILF